MIWAAVAVGLVITLFGASAAAALITVSRTALAEAVSRRLRGSTESLDWLRDAERELSAATATTALGIAVLAAGLAAVVQLGSGDLPIWAALVLLVLVAVPFVLFSGYVLPRWLTAQRASRVADRVRPILRPWAQVLGVLLPEPTNRRATDVRSLWREGVAGALGPSEELMMVGNVISFAQRTVRDVMTPRTNLVAIPEESGYDEVTEAFIQSGYSRLPVYRGTVDEIVGMVHVFDLLKINPGDPVPVRPVVMAPASRSAGDVLLDMQRERRHLAVVLDEFGGTLGIVTLEDLLEAMVGEIFDQHEHTAERRAVGAPAVEEIDGGTAVAEVEERFGITLPDAPSRTIGGRLTELAGRIPQAGERFLVRGVEFEVLGVSPSRIQRLLVRRRPLPAVPLG
jgi:CBS domain containing-hemolysin-like protein